MMSSLLFKNILRDLRLPTKQLTPISKHIQAAVDWLCFAQDIAKCGGVSLRYSLIKGWQPPYPETTGYIIPTFIDYAMQTKKSVYFERAIKMADWLLSIQNEDGSFNGGPFGSGYDSFVFDTGQIIFGLLAAHKKTGKERFIEGAIEAGRWLVKLQDREGMWKKNTFNSIPHVYYTRVAWALAELGLHLNDNKYKDAACKNIDWALLKQRVNGWFDDAGFTIEAHNAPYTHTIAYTIEGILETGICLNNKDYIDAATVSAKFLLKIIHNDGNYAGTYDKAWKSQVKYSCLTGNAQIALILLRLYELDRNEEYLTTARSLNRFLCRVQVGEGPAEIRGAISGSYPLWGKYQRFAFPNWAAKFFVDSLLLEQKILNLHAAMPNENLHIMEK